VAAAGRRHQRRGPDLRGGVLRARTVRSQARAPLRAWPCTLVSRAHACVFATPTLLVITIAILDIIAAVHGISIRFVFASWLLCVSECV